MERSVAKSPADGDVRRPRGIDYASRGAGTRSLQRSPARLSQPLHGGDAGARRHCRQLSRRRCHQLFRVSAGNGGRSSPRRTGGMDDPSGPQADERQIGGFRACRADRHRHRSRHHPPEAGRSLRRERGRRLPEQSGAAAGPRFGKHCERLRSHAKAGRKSLRI